MVQIILLYNKIEKEKQPIENRQESFDENNISNINTLLDTTAKEELRRPDVMINKQTEERLLENFERAHESQFYLKKGLNLNYLAELLGTNHRYVSYILNKYTGMDFNSYVQQSRISYLIEKIEEDPTLIYVKFSVLSEMAGFSSVSKFSTVFKSVKGMPPSEYLRKFRVGHQQMDLTANYKIEQQKISMDVIS
jgi:AraC-like DNA-binding protein